MGRKPGGSERPHESEGVDAGEGRHRHSHQLAALVELVQGLSKETNLRQLLLANRGHEQDRELTQAAPEKGQEADAHLVGPVDILQHDEQWLPPSETLEELTDRLEGVAGISSAPTRELLARQGSGRLPLAR